MSNPSMDIKRGLAVIVYDACENNPAWVLPGGRRITSKAIAVQWANKINNMLKGA
ncbi:MAG: hypothetical protein ACPG5Z_06530 [Pseudoalteromonas sp.]